MTKQLVLAGLALGVIALTSASEAAAARRVKVNQCPSDPCHSFVECNTACTTCTGDIGNKTCGGGHN